MRVRHRSSQVSNVSGASVYTDGKYFQFNHFESLNNSRVEGLVAWITKWFCSPTPTPFINVNLLAILPNIDFVGLFVGTAGSF